MSGLPPGGHRHPEGEAALGGSPRLFPLIESGGTTCSHYPELVHLERGALGSWDSTL